MMSRGLSDRTKMWMRRAAAKAGVEIAAYTGSLSEHRTKLLSTVNTVWDIGAHVGQYGSLLRAHGYRRKIISVEPAVPAYEQLVTTAAGDEDWSCVQAAVGAVTGEALLHVAANGQSSSLYPMLPQHVVAAPGSEYVATQEVGLRTLDELSRTYAPPGPHHLKLDVQGYEKEVLLGGTTLLEDAQSLEVELSLCPLYAGAPSWIELVLWLADRGFRLCDMARVFSDQETLDLLQINGLFVRPAP